MAGAGFKTFNTGDVLTAADVNTYLMQQTVMVFASSAARSTALGANVAEGMLSYLKDTDVVEVYNGSSWVASDDPNAIQNSIVDAKGDLISATADNTPARLASSGVNGNVLTVDTSTSTGLKWAAPAAGGDTFAAGKNKFINADFRINQRGFTSTTTNGTYGFDRWKINNGDGTVTYSAQTFTPGAAPVAGYEGINYARIVTSGQTASSANALLVQQIEDVRTFAGQTVTVSFWAKAASGTPKIAVVADQYFGTGGSPSSDVLTAMGQPTISTSWARYSVTATIPSISGKTIGTNASTNCLEMRFWVSAGSNFNTQTNSLGIQSNTFELWGIQIEAGSTATDFQTASGTLGGELALCQRYYYRTQANSSNNHATFGTGQAVSTTQAYIYIKPAVTMRTVPGSVEYGGTIRVTDNFTYGQDITTLAIRGERNENLLAVLATIGTAVLTSREALALSARADANAYVAFSSEL